MQSALQHPSASPGRFMPHWRGPPPSRHWQRPPSRSAGRRPLLMPSDRVFTTEQKWGLLIRAIADQEDRAAFAALFEYFAPRIKAFMQRSGVGEASCEELAQETMLALWRKAALFDPASTGAAAWIFTIARNLRIDAYRREQRGGAMQT